MSCGWREQQQQHPPCERLAPPPAAPRTAALSLLDLPEAGGEQPPVPQLPEALVLAILARLPPDAQAWGGKLVCRSAAATLRGRRRIRARSAELPLWALQQQWARQTLSRHQWGELLEARAAAGDAAGAAWLAAQGCPLDRRAAVAAVAAGSLAMLRWMAASAPGFPWDDPPYDLACTAAAAEGHVHVLEFLRLEVDPPCEWNALTCAAAARGGHLPALEWLRRQDPPCAWSARSCYEAAAVGGAAARAALEWLRSQDPPCEWDAWTCTAAAQRGDLGLLKWLRACTPLAPMDEAACCAAAFAGQLACLQWLRDSEGCPWDRGKCVRMAAGHPAVREWLEGQPG